MLASARSRSRVAIASTSCWWQSRILGLYCISLSQLNRITRRNEAQLPNPVDFDITLSDLTPGTPYRLQLLFHEPGITAIGDRQFNVLIPGDPIFDFDPVAYGSGNSGEHLKTGVVITHDFAASSSSFTVSFTRGSGNVPFVNGVTLEMIPEPSTLALLLLGGLTLLARGRSRRRGKLS